jgi:glutaredoxin 3
MFAKIISMDESLWIQSYNKQTRDITIYTWDHCPYCKKALALLNSKSLRYQQIKLDGDEEAREKMSLKTKGNRKSVPQIFIGAESVGGCDDLHALDASGELDRLVYES